MSQENAELARRALEIYNTHDVTVLQGMATEDVEFRTFLEGRVQAEPLHGYEGICEWQWSESGVWESLEVEPDESRHLGANRMLAAGRVRGPGRASGIELDALAAWIIAVRGSEVCAFHAYAGRAEALEATGLPE